MTIHAIYRIRVAVKVSGDGATKHGRQWPAGVLSNIDALNERFSCHRALCRDLSQPKPVFGFEPQGRLVAVKAFIDRPWLCQPACMVTDLSGRVGGEGWS